MLPTRWYSPEFTHVQWLKMAFAHLSNKKVLDLDNKNCMFISIVNNDYDENVILWPKFKIFLLKILKVSEDRLFLLYMSLSLPYVWSLNK